MGPFFVKAFNCQYICQWCVYAGVCLRLTIVGSRTSINDLFWGNAYVVVVVVCDACGCQCVC